jgi:hypothetical protein
VAYGNPDIVVPDKYPYWENPLIWDKYNELCYIKAGFKDNLKPYLQGSLFCKLSDITNNNLIKLIIDHTQGLRDGEYLREQASAFYGGYVLRVDEQDKYFPQCCGDLSDIIYWDRVSKGQNSFCEGHPSPLVKFESNKIIFDFSVREYDECFQPPPKEILLTIDKYELAKAVETVKIELQTFEQRLNKINETEKLNIDNIGGLLIWDNANYD